MRQGARFVRCAGKGYRERIVNERRRDNRGAQENRPLRSRGMAASLVLAGLTLLNRVKNQAY
jgi:hypothetical protein